jgi:aryl carrier-like protein
LTKELFRELAAGGHVALQDGLVRSTSKAGGANVDVRHAKGIERSQARNGAPHANGERVGHQHAGKSSGKARADETSAMRALVARILKVQEADVEMDVDVSQHGLDSINVMLLLARMKEEFGVNIDASELVARRTLRELAGFVMSRRNAA